MGGRNTGDVSLSQLSEVSAKAEALRENLRKALIDHAPRFEVCVFESLMCLLDNFLQPPASDNFSHSVREDTNYLIERYYLQEVFAALLLLVGEDDLDGVEVAVGSAPHRVASEVPQSAFYVDIHTRRYCRELLLYLCFSRVHKKRRVVRALYPLLLNGSTKQSGEVSQNHISEGLFASSRFKSRKKLVSGILNGIVLSFPDGIRSVIDVLLLDDRVDDSMSVHAAKHIASLFTIKLDHAWLCGDHWKSEKEEQQENEQIVTVRYCKNISLEEQIRALSSQLVAIAVCHAAAPLLAKEKVALPAFLQGKQKLERNLLVKPETLEERLHICLATILNTVSQLPLRSEDETYFKRCYKRFYLYNKYFFTPAFRALTLRTSVNAPNIPAANTSAAVTCEGTSGSGGISSNGADEVVKALSRFCALAKGSTLGPSSLALLLALPPVAPGLLELVFVQDSLPPPHRFALQQLLSALWKIEGKYEEMAHIFVRGALSPVRGSVTIDRVSGFVGVDLRTASPTVRRIRGLQELVMSESTPSGLCRGVLLAAAKECQQRAAKGNTSPDDPSNSRCGGTGGSDVGLRPQRRVVNFLYSNTIHDQGEEEVGKEICDRTEEITLVRMVECICLGTSADAVFGAEITLGCVCDVLAVVATISFVCWRWTVLLIPKVFCKDVVTTVFAQHATIADRRKAAEDLLLRGERLFSVLTALHAAVDSSSDDVSAAAEGSLAAAMETSRQYSSNVGSEGHSVHDDHDATGNTVSYSSEDEVRSTYRRLAVEAEKCLETRSTGSLVVHLLALSRMAEDEASKRRNAPSHYSDKLVGAVQPALHVLSRVLAEVDDACAAVAAIKTMVWWALARADSPDSSFIGNLLIYQLSRDVRGRSSKFPLQASVAATPVQLDRMKVRLLDVLLGLCDYDTEGRTLRNIDDYSRQMYGYSLYDLLRELCGPRHSVAVQVAALHLVGHFVIAVAPRVSVELACVLCKDVFRHTPHAMAKAAAAAMLVCISSSLEVFGEGSVEPLLRMADAMRNYRDAAVENTVHEDVIRRHGERIKGLLEEKQFMLPVQEIRES
ncbi:hypothetical protein, conserved [Trypanosoma brucei gambiense DAL972]|uniref:Uncharacterized protein n=1 Tax=Trypanosoma brucei gambiense (strain MHOM/CI/86/DAL972) TaxID=679716 RepID=C9ZS58_TRYB9|nr:hypothetical protein, conserved [Trypanosoma brucei gambiense DAL972]CBH12194.1 hypothetical protein, conserved [Trypanosoma brucei gambiense DAL972]|eukprot:XP_011774477.1 hypothetical protein, conserved [Trypanosoma brucei gambiense DAL972]